MSHAQHILDTIRAALPAAWDEVRADHPDAFTPPRYGPHDESTAPTVVVVRGPEKNAQDREEPIPVALVEQRRRINELARGAA